MYYVQVNTEANSGFTSSKAQLCTIDILLRYFLKLNSVENIYLVNQLLRRYRSVCSQVPGSLGFNSNFTSRNVLHYIGRASSRLSLQTCILSPSG